MFVQSLKRERDAEAAELQAAAAEAAEIAAECKMQRFIVQSGNV